MGITKIQNYTDEQNRLAMLGKAFSHPARIAIIQHLLKTKQCINGDLVQELGIAQATVSQHLKELKNIGLVQGTVEGTSMNYCIDPETWHSMRSQFEAIFASFDGPEGPCC
uniref:Metalloregulator ArsR/SmtB family transcription factor n=1 Tax=Roseihalotalea indica TaxID=2867963 RepID=A0AA49JHQ3_9BACT|nr:metalloregulator ArsR/SmtB family transcription factor [Tunicatimonas sp. TK19036]